METWSAGKAVLQGMGLEITRDFLFFDLPEVLLEEAAHWRFDYSLTRLVGMLKSKNLPVQTLDDESFSRVLSLQFLHHIVKLVVQLQSNTNKHCTDKIFIQWM